MQNLTNAKFLFRYEASFQVSSGYWSNLGIRLEQRDSCETAWRSGENVCYVNLKSKQLDFESWSRFYTKERESYVNLQAGVLYLQIV